MGEIAGEMRVGKDLPRLVEVLDEVRVALRKMRENELLCAGIAGEFPRLACRHVRIFVG